MSNSSYQQPRTSPYPPINFQSNPPPPPAYQQQHSSQSHSHTQATYAPPSQPPPSRPQQNTTSHNPTNQTDQLREWFDAVDSNGDGDLSSTELRAALVNSDFTPFEEVTVEMLMKIFDTDKSNTIAFEEFSGLWRYIREWQGVFRTYDTDKSGTIEAKELALALSKFGYNLSPHAIRLLIQKYSSKGKNGLTFDRFLRCCVAVQEISTSFKRADVNNSGYVQLNQNQLMEIVLSAP